MKATLLFLLLTFAACLYATPMSLTHDNVRDIESPRSVFSAPSSSHPSWKLVARDSISASSASSTPGSSFFSSTQPVSNAMVTGLCVAIAIETAVLIVLAILWCKEYRKHKGSGKDAGYGGGNGPDY